MTIRIVECASVAALICSSILVQAQDKGASEKNPVMVWGAGNVSCGQFVKVIGSNPGNERVFGQWLHRFISGLNEADRTTVDYAAGLDRDALMTWVTNYCRNNPLDSFYGASRALVNEMTVKERIKSR